MATAKFSSSWRKVLALLFCMCVPGSIGAQEAASGTKRAVLIGINNFEAVRDLSGTHNDVDSMLGVLVNRFRFERDNVRVLKDEKATYAAVKDAIYRDLILASGPNDIIVIYFSGHGSRAPDDDGDEADGWDETLLTSDARTDNVYDIRDDEFGEWLQELSRRTPNVTVILDTCNSGTGARADVTGRFVPPDARLAPPDTFRPSSFSRDAFQEVMPLGSNFVLLTGSAAEEFSNEDYLDGAMRGVMTHYLVRQLEAAPRSTYRSLFRPVQLQVNALFPSQHPQIEGNGLDSFVFGTDRPSIERTIFVDPLEVGMTVTVQAGSVFGVRKDSRISIYGPGDAPPTAANKLADATIIDVGASTSIARLNSNVEIPSGSRARLGDVLLRQRPMVVNLSPDVPEEARGQIKASLPPAISLLSPDGNADAGDLVLTRSPVGWQILGRDRSLRTTLPGSSAIELVVSKLVGWARWEAVRELRNPTSSLDVDFDVKLFGAPQGSQTPNRVSSGSYVTLHLKNNSTVPLYINILDITSLGLIKRLLPKEEGSEIRLMAGESYSQNILLTVPSGADAVTDDLLMLATTSPLDTTVFEQGRLRSPATPGPLDSMFLQWTRGSRDASLPTLEDWAVRTRTVEVTKSGLDRDLVRFAVHTTDSPSTLRGTLDSARSDLCGSDSAVGCVHVEPLSEVAGVFEVDAPRLRGTRGASADATASVGALFEEAYALRERTGADYVEPLLSVQMDDISENARTRGGDEESFPLAESDARWSLKYANVPEAWRQMQLAGRPEKREAQGVILAHIDTGYTTHPEMVDASNPPVLANRGYNYLNKTADAKDPRTSAGVLKHPGHGTAAGSVIVSPDGCQLPGKAHCPSGTGRGAQLLPIRLNDSVVMFSTSKLSRALFDIAEGRRGTDIQAISLAMGGPPSLSLWKATRAVEKKGILFFAAAGNYVQTVVWPARFDSAIAVSAINPDCRPWRHASHGNAVDISAPGQGVWRATFKGDEPDVGMGAGTTFATGTMAGIGALWLAHHKNNPVLAQLRADGELTTVFRGLVQRSSWRPDAPQRRPSAVSCQRSWKGDEYGAGIVNAAALLAEPLGVSRAVVARTEQAMPLYASVYPAAADPRQVAHDFSVLLNTTAKDAAYFQTEVLYHYTEMPDVRLALDALIVGDRTLAAYQRVRDALLAQDLSESLRSHLGATGM